MGPEEFKKKVAHLDQIEIITGAVDSISRLLVDKKIVTAGEIRNYFLKWMRRQERVRTKRKK